MLHWTRDLQFALRGFRKSPVYSAVAVLSLALGIGANTAIFTLVNQLILRRLPVQDPDRLVQLVGEGRHYGSDMGVNPLSYPMFQDLSDGNQVFSGLMCRYRVNPSVMVVGETEVVGGELVSGDYFRVLGIQPAAGRLFTADDDVPLGAHPYAVLSYAWWQSRFAGDPNAVGRTIRVNGTPVTIAGVAQAGFDGVEPGLAASIFVAINVATAVRPGFTDMLNRRHRWVTVYGRLNPGITATQAQAGLQPLFHQILAREAAEPAFRNATAFDKEQFLKMRLSLMPGSQGNAALRAQYERPLWVLMGVVGLVLLIACANLASLLTARAASRRREIAIRLAVGCSRVRMMQQLLAECLMLSIAGGAAGIGLAVVMVEGLLRFLPANITGYAISSSPDYRVLGFTLGLCIVTGIGFGLAPALQSTRPDLAPALKDQGGSGSGVGGAQLNIRKAAVVAQVALCLLLLIGAGLFLRSLSNLRSIDPGFRTSNILQFSIAPRSAGYDAARTAAFYRSLEQRLQSLPGIHSAGLGSMALLTPSGFARAITVEGYRATRGEVMKPQFDAVSPGYFETMGMQVLAGRNFSIKDDNSAPRVAMVNARFVNKYFGDQLAVGRHIGLGADPGTPTDIEIIGVVNDVRYDSLRSELAPQVYLCTLQQQPNAQLVYVRAEGNPQSVPRTIQTAVHELGPGLPIFNLKTLERQVDESLVTDRMIATLSAVFGILATVLAIVGLYGVTAFTVTRRAREIGIRMALGARAGSVVGLVMREVLVLVLAGVVMGLPTAVVLGRFVAAQLYGVASNDIVSMALATILLIAVALVAAWAPARRAAGHDPVRVLRAE